MIQHACKMFSALQESFVRFYFQNLPCGVGAARAVEKSEEMKRRTGKAGDIIVVVVLTLRLPTGD